MVMRDPKLPTLVYLPGGPGDTSLEFAENTAILEYLLPLEANIMLTEPRGVGCNKMPDGFPIDAFSSSEISADVAAAIEIENLHNFSVFGWSYGTALATHLSEDLRAINLQPVAYILMGTMGKHLAKEFDPYWGFQREWSKVKSVLPPDVVLQFSRHPLPLDIEAEVWAKYISQNLMIKHTGQPALEASLAVLNSPDKAARESLENHVRQTVAQTQVQDPNFDLLYETLLCAEFSLTDNTDLTLVQGELVGKQNPDICKNRPLKAPFDAKDFTMNAPIFYFQGDNDPATTLENAQYHRLSQQQLPQQFITVADGAHFPLALLYDCKEQLWKEILLAGDKLGPVLKGCKAATTIEGKIFAILDE
jgi:pimeloyl-ACP methyl ester carboxylesterase